MKKLLSLALVLVMVFALAACGVNTPPVEPSDKPGEPDADNVDYSSMTLEELKPLIKTVQEGKLTVATSPDFAPYEFYAIDENGEASLAGFDVALAGYVAEFLGLELEIIPMDFDGILAEFTSKNIDLGMAGFSPKPEREVYMDFSDYYYIGGQSFVTNEANKDKITDLESANKPEYSIGAQNGSIQMDLALRNTPDAEILNLTKVTDIIAEVVGNKLDGAFIETVVAECYQKNYPELHIVCEVPYEDEGSVIGVDKGNDVLLAAVNLAIKAAIDDGSMAQFVTEANELSTGEKYEGLIEDYIPKT